MSEGYADGRPLTIKTAGRVAGGFGGRVIVVLATYNGSRYLGEQIASIQKQSYKDWILLARDDGSRDATRDLLDQVAAKDARVRVVHDERGNLGAIGNFGALMEKALGEGADYLFFADQDDVWHPEKMAVMLGAMRVLEGAVPEGTPLLMHSDLRVVDESLAEKAESFMRYSRLTPESTDLGGLLCQNQVTGCAAVINRRLLELACPVPAQVLMHDWWLAQLAAASGKIGYLPERLVSYRQHGGNVLGAVSQLGRILGLLSSKSEWVKFAKVVRGSVSQARLLIDRLASRGYQASPLDEGRLSAYAGLFAHSRLMRPLLLRRWRIGKPGLAKGWVFNMVVMCMKRDRND